MLWLASSEGLFRFDGMRFERVDSVGGQPLLAVDISAVAAFGNALWVGYRFGGVSVFESGKVTHYREAQGLPQRTVVALARAPDGVMWAGTPSGVYRQEGQRWRAVGAEDGLQPLELRAFTVAPNGALIAYMPNGMYLKPANSRRFHAVPGVPVIEGGDLRADGRILLRAENRQLFIFDAVTERVAPLPLPRFHLPRLDVMQDGRGSLWITSPRGLHLLDPTGAVRATYSKVSGLSGRMFYTSYADREGNFWITTEAGVDRISAGRVNKLESLPAQSAFMSVRAGDNGEVWVGSMVTGVNYDSTMYRVRADGQRIATSVQGVSASTRGADGSLWFAGQGVLWRIHGSQHQRIAFPPALQDAAVQSMALDAHGTLWLSFAGRGVHTLREGHWQRPSLEPLAQRTAIALHADARGRLWFGYPNNRAAMLTADGALHDFGPAQGLAVGNVLTFNSRGDHVWLGGDRALAYWDGRRFTNLRDRDGRAFMGLSGVLESAAGELWLHGVDGIARARAADVAGVAAGRSTMLPVERFDYLDGYEGVAGQIRPLPSLAESSDGRIWFATTASAGWIDPRHIRRNALAPTPQVLVLRSERRPYNVAQPVRLDAGTEDVQIDFTAAVLTVPERARFRYRLLGLETAWREAGTRRQAFYTNLGPGEYRFEVLAANEDGVWSTQPAYLDFSLAPTFTQTVMFKLLGALVLLLTVYALLRWRVQSATARVTQRLTEQLQARLDERTRIARTLHDSFLQTVHALILRFDAIKQQMPAGDPLRDDIENALDAADAVLVEGRDQLWALRSADAGPAGLEETLRETATVCGRQYGLKVSLVTQGAPLPVPADVREEVLAIAREALHNVGRHARAGSAVIELHYHARGVALRVADDGCGIADELLASAPPPGRWGLAGMRERAQLIGATLRIARAVDGGTELCLYVPLVA